MTKTLSYVEQVVEAWETNYKSGLLTFWILVALSNGEKHIQQIKSFIENDITTNLRVDEKSLYRSMARFKKLELVFVRDEPSVSGGPSLKMYSLSKQGTESLQLFLRRNISEVFLTPQFNEIVEDIIK